MTLGENAEVRANMLGDDRFDAIEAQLNRRFETARREQEDLRVYLETILREHIDNQVRQINSSLAFADKLDLERINSMRQLIEGLVARVHDVRDDLEERLSAVRRELQQSSESAKEAVLKAEVATEKRFEGTNEWRAQSADREQSQAQEIARLSAGFMPREVADAKYEELRRVADSRYEEVTKAISTNIERFAHTTGEHLGGEKFIGYIFQVITFLVALGAVIAIVLKG